MYKYNGDMCELLSWGGEEETEHELCGLLKSEAVVITGDFPIIRNEEDEGLRPSPLLDNPEIE